MEEAGLKGLVIDYATIRGFAHAICSCCGKIYQSRPTHVSTEGRDDRELDRLTASVIGHRTLPMVILINGGSASALKSWRVAFRI